MIIYLYVKTHLKTGLKYLGITSKQDPHAYCGSGKLWKEHLKEHGKNYKTEILFESISMIEIKEQGLYYSNFWDVVNSDQWANLKKERGNGGWTPIKGRNPWNKGKTMSDKQRQKISQTKTGKYKSTNNPFYGKSHSEKTKKILQEANTGRQIDPEIVKARNEKQKGVPKPSVSAKLKGKPKSEEHKEKMRLAWIKRRQSTSLQVPPGYSP